MIKTHKIYLMLVILMSCVGCDQISKNIAKNSLQSAPPRSYLGETFRLQYAENTGAFLSLGARLSKTWRTWLFTVVSGLLLVGLTLYLLFNRELNQSHVWALSLILGGGFSNLLDRILNDGKVVDFMNVGIGGLRTGIFNFADMVIMFGMGMILLLNFRMHRRQKAENDTLTEAVDSDDQRAGSDG